MDRGRAWGETILALGVVLLGAFIAYEVSQLRVAPMYAKVGPRIVPYLVAGALVVVGLALLREAWQAPEPGHALDPPAESVDWRAGLTVAAGLLLQAVLYERAGFLIAAALGYVAVAWGFGSRRLVLDIATGVVLAVLIQLVFGYGLGLRLPAGVLRELGL